jgi:hypothetical protein
MQQERRTGRTIVVLAVFVVVTVALAATGRLPALAQAWEEVASSVAASRWFPGSSSATGDAGAPGGDAGAKMHRQAAPLSSAQLGAPLVHGAFVSACGAPDDMKIMVTMAVKMGRAVDVTVSTTPPDPTVASCIERATRDLQWDVSPHVGHVSVKY